MSQWFASVGLMELNEGTILLRILLAAVFGGLLGFERARKMRAAGLRTYMLVCIGASIAMMTGQFLLGTYGVGDPGRIAAQVISGIGFLGAGTIMMSGYHRVKGLTTAAGLWVAGCLGVAVGAGFYVGSVVMLVITLLAMLLGERFQDHFMEKSGRVRLFVLFDDADSMRDFLVYLRERGLGISEFENAQPVGHGVSANFVLKLQNHHRSLRAEVLAVPTREQIAPIVDEQAIVELYSR